MAVAIDLAPNSPYGLPLQTRVLAAAGCFGYGVEYARLVDIDGVGAIITRSTTLHGRRTARAPRLLETAAGVLSVGEWPDPGLSNVLGRYGSTWASWTTPVILSLQGTTPEDFAACAGALEGVEGVAGLELNLMAHAAAAARIVSSARAATLLPIVAKLPAAGAAGENLAALARSVVEAGADVLTVAASPPGRAADPYTGEIVTGWLSGPALMPLALLAVADVAAAVDAPIIGGGGIATVDDARHFLAAGAAAVQIGAALLADPEAVVRIGASLNEKA